MPVKRLGKPPFLSVNEVEDGEIFEIVGPPYLTKDRWGKERYRVTVRKPSDREFGLRTWTLNATTSNRLLDAFGENENLWVGKKVRIRKHEEIVLGKQKYVLYGEPYLEPQKQLQVLESEC